MNSEKPNTCPKSYDAIEDAINLSKKDPTRTWDELAGTAQKQRIDKSDQDALQNKDKIAARAESHGRS
jgi:hypothetical protein